MAEITVSINSRPFQVLCANGEEAQVLRLAEDLSARVATIRQQGGKASDSHMLVLAAITLCSELRDLHRDVAALKADVEKAEDARHTLSERLNDVETQVADALNATAESLEAVLATGK